MPGAWGLPRKMHRSFKKAKEKRASAAGTTGNSSWSCGAMVRALYKGGQQTAMGQGQEETRKPKICLQEPRLGFTLLS